MDISRLFRKRKYLHFDEPLEPSESLALASNKEIVASWPFMPMLRCVVTTLRLKRTSTSSFPETTPKERPICYSCHKDAAIYSYYGNMLSGIYEAKLKEAGLDTVATAFRRSTGKNNIDLAKEVFDWIKLYAVSKGPCAVLAFDVKGFFDNIDHKMLKQKWTALIGEASLPPDHFAVFKSITKYSYVERSSALSALGISKHNPRSGGKRRLCTANQFRTKIARANLIVKNSDIGIPQGSPMSAVLSNIFMLDFDRTISRAVNSVGGLYRRYCDDIVCVVPSSQKIEIERLVKSSIERANLEIQDRKTTRHSFVASGQEVGSDRPFQYLGFVFDGKRVLLRDGGIAKYYRKMRSAVRLAAAAKRRLDQQDDERDSENNPIRRTKIYTKYSYFGGRNYLSYAFRAARIFNETAIKKQVRGHWKKLTKLISNAEKAVE